MLYLIVHESKLGLENIGSLFTWGSKEYIIQDAMRQINKETEEPTSMIVLQLTEVGIPGPAGPD